MHILVTNDDGPPSPTSSPYVHSLVRELQKRGHTVSVCLPHAQRSWIGKAHMIGQTVKPLYYRPSATFDPSPSAASQPQGTVYTRPGTDRKEEEWVLVDGTPASCAQIGLHHFFKEKGPIDLVVSGPNYGRNTTAVFALSSGTLGGALEAAVCKKKAIALSYAFFSRNHDPVIIDAATRHSVRVIEKLYAQWPTDKSVDLYSVNVPLVEGVDERKTLWTEMLQNYWGESSVCFEEVEGSVGDEEEEEERIREGEEAISSGAVDSKANGNSGETEQTRYPHRHFKWAPKFADVYKSVEESPPGNDGWAVKEGFTSVTPMKANFYHTATHLYGEELKLDKSDSLGMAVPASTLIYQPKHHFYALVAYEDPYVQPLILSALEKFFPPESYTLLSTPDSVAQGEPVPLSKLLPENSSSPVLQITPYEAIDWDYVDSHAETCMVNSYMLRKALIRKHYLSATVEQWVAKRPESVLKTHVKRSEAFELDYAEFLDDALIEAFDLRASLEKNAANEPGHEVEWWILKPSMSDRGQGIRLFSTMEDLQGIFDEWEENLPDSEDEDEEGDDDAASNPDADSERRNDITTSHLRHFVAQPYIHPPLLLPGDNRKFHIRTYVACVGRLDVYVYRDMLALFAGKPYTAPTTNTSSAAAAPDLEAHLTNTCLQRSVDDGTVRRFWELPLPPRTKADVFAQICDVTGEVFEAAARAMQMHFRPLGNAFEVFGLDFLVDARGTPWLLEVNAFPDFRQTGDELRGLVQGLWEEVLRRAALPFLGVGDEDGAGAGADRGEEEETEGKRLVLVRRVDLGR
ncbi:sure-like protein [Daldinia caldariorum]|uniref:sure-like protein n=1 Tax=Daldinia caldariorum TaxID=326644 RepID=UPI0020081B37|nr:sure-like protein [Daldinia caldariorum]KAI1473063.1 sure-like protein [Daldinia caldariorum]